jgi:hypothetical protein
LKKIKPQHFVIPGPQQNAEQSATAASRSPTAVGQPLTTHKDSHATGKNTNNHKILHTHV